MRFCYATKVKKLNQKTDAVAIIKKNLAHFDQQEKGRSLISKTQRPYLYNNREK